MALFTARTGLAAARVLPTLQQLVRDDLIEVTGAQWRATLRGQQYLNDVVQRFLPDRNSQAGAGS
jgi:coproporphyrinogen III oxidase-like Fe-S oxidoreductase